MQTTTLQQVTRRPSLNAMHWARFTISGLTHPFTMMKKFRFSITFNRAWEHQQALGYYSLYTPLQRGLGAPQLILSALGLRPV